MGGALSHRRFPSDRRQKNIVVYLDGDGYICRDPEHHSNMNAELKGLIEEVVGLA